MRSGRRACLAGLWGALAGSLALLLAGCGPCQRPPEEAAPDPAAAPARTEEARAPAEARGVASLPGPGSAVVEASERGVTALANAAPRLEVLRLLEKEAGFLLVVGRLGQLAPVTLRAVELPLEAVLSQVLEGLAYESRYQADPERGGHVLTTVVVGSFKTRVASRLREQRAKRRKLRDRERLEAERRVAGLSPEEQEWEREEREAQRREAEERLAREIEDSDARVRAEALRQVAPEGEGVQRLGELLSRDPAPEVRAAAADRLGGSDSFAAIEFLLQSLSDPDPRVVIAALDSLEDIGDESIIPMILKLSGHPDPEVREAAEDTADWLR